MCRFFKIRNLLNQLFSFFFSCELEMEPDESRPSSHGFKTFLGKHKERDKNRRRALSAAWPVADTQDELLNNPGDIHFPFNNFSNQHQNESLNNLNGRIPNNNNNNIISNNNQNKTKRFLHI